MKKIILLSVLFFGLVLTSNAQKISKNALGLRFGINNGFGAELSYQNRLTSDNRLEVDLGIRGDSNYFAVKATALYQWVGEIENGLNWYAGFGGGLGNWTVKETRYTKKNSNLFFFGAGIVGIEYNFDGLPLVISLDFRPEFGFSDYYNGFGTDFGLSLRYQF